MRATCSIAFAVSLAFFGLCSPCAAQSTDGVKELMGKAQSESQRRAVEDLINKLQNRATGAKPASPEPKAAPAVSAPVPPPAASAEPAATAAPTVATTPPAPTATVPQTPPAAKQEKSPARANVAPQPPPNAPQPTAAAGPGPSDDLPSVDLEVYFEYATAKLTQTSMPTLVALGLSLADPRLATQTFIIGGYTDSKGKPDYNLRLSQQRADMVRQFLINEYKIDPKRLISIGYGKNHFKNGTDSQAGENRRVQIINWTTQLPR